MDGIARTANRTLKKHLAILAAFAFMDYGVTGGENKFGRSFSHADEF